MKGLILGVLLVTTASGFAQEKVVIGRLGQAVKESVITSKAGGGRKYYTVKAYEYLVLRTGPKGYYKVLLQNGSEGFVPSDAVARLPYDVTKTKSANKKSGPSVTALTFTGTPLSDAERRQAIAQYSTKFEGTPYVWGGNDPLNGIDCSAFVKFLYGKIGVNLPRTAAEQVKVGKPITRLEDLQPGDRLYFWSSKRNKIGHTGIYLGNGYFCHSSTNNKGVATDYLGEKKWLNILVAARR
jgi:cell wall-associated NlpC family hydrolase